MATIGTFTAHQGGYVGTIRTLTINVKTKLVPNKARANSKAPDFRVYAGGAELGAAWRAKDAGEDSKPHLSVLLDDPSFPTPIRAAFFENAEEGTGVLVWSRPNGR
jgi:uncharacterized protein (DUF736 family)